MNITNNKEVITSVRDRIVSMLDRRNSDWEGTMTDLLAAITQGRQVPELFPASGASLRRVVNKAVAGIRRAGYRVEFTRTTDRARTRIVNFSRVSKRS